MQSPLFAGKNSISSSFNKRSPDFRVAHVRYFQKLKQEKIAKREEFSDDEENDEEGEGHKEDEVSEFEIPLKKIETQKASQKRLCIPKK